MLRFLLWLLIIYFGFRVIKILFSLSQRPKEKKNNIQQFSHIEEADFEDITPKDEETSDYKKNL